MQIWHLIPDALRSPRQVSAEAVVIPEMEIDPETLAGELRAAYDHGKAHALVVVAEGASHNTERLANYFREHRARLSFDPRVTPLGHVQRGGAPSAVDRLLATRLGAAATEHLTRGDYGLLVGLPRGEIVATRLADVVAAKKPPDLRLLELARVLARWPEAWAWQTGGPEAVAWSRPTSSTCF